jgi:hypothetical protein
MKVFTAKLFVLTLLFAMSSCYTVHKDVGIIYADAYPQAKEKLDINKGTRGGKVFNDSKKPVIVVRADATQTNVNESEFSDRYVEYLWIESALIEQGYTVKDRVLVDNVAGSTKKRDYAEMQIRTGVDMIVDVGSTPVKNIEADTYFNQRLNQQRTLNSSVKQSISIPVYNIFGKVTDVRTGQFIGDFNLVTNGIATKNLKQVNTEVLTRKSKGIIDYDMTNSTELSRVHRAVFIFPCYIPFGLVGDFFTASAGAGILFADLMFGAYREKGTDYLHGKNQFYIESDSRAAMKYSVNKILAEF